MAGKSASASPWKPEHEAWLRAHDMTFKTQSSRELLEAFRNEFPDASTTQHRFRMWVVYIRDGGHAQTPPSPVGSLTDLIVRLPWRTFIVTADHQIPYHDPVFMDRVLSLGEAWNVEGHVLNGDLWDMATISKFVPQIYGERVPLGEELQIGGDFIDAVIRRHGQALFVMGNHDQRLTVKLLEGQLTPEQARRLLSSNERLRFTQLRFCIMDGYPDDPIRITHPNTTSVIAGAVGADLARNHAAHVIVAHDHLVCQRRSHNGRWTVTHSGMCADPTKLAYAFAVDNRRPLMNQGAVVVHPNAEGKPVFRLLDPKNIDWDLELHLARKGRHIAA